MSSTDLSIRPLSRAALSAAQLTGLGLALALFAPALSRAQAPAVPDTPTVSPAPIVDKPLQPAVAQEVPEPQPSPQHSWVPGHWRWQEGSYVWVSGHWELPPVPNSAWMAPHWETKGSGYVLVDGYWQQASSPPPAAAPGPQETVVVVDEPPPPPAQYREVVIERPSPAHIWIGGHWSLRLGRHVWVAGHWELPPHEHAVWVEPRWERRGNGYVLVEGFWRDAGVSVSVGSPAPRVEVVIGRPSHEEVVVIGNAPPPPRREIILERDRPSPRHVWIKGYWVWRGGRHEWLAGHWELPPRPNAVWVEPRWEHRGNGYVFIEGVWR
jgi:hypothetical protein